MKLTSLISSVMIDMLALSAVDHRLKPQLNQTKDFNIGISCFSAKHAALRSKSKEMLARNKDNDVSEWSNMSTCGLSFPWASTKHPTSHAGLVQSGHYHLTETQLFLAMIWLKNC